MKTNRGFTLIETIIYIGIFSILMSGVLISVYSLLSSNTRNQARAMVQEEGSFLVGKIDWALTSVKQNTIVVTDPTNLSLEKYDGTKIYLSVSGNKMSIKRNTDTQQDLNNSNVEITCPALGCFIHTSSYGEGVNPEKVEAKIIVTSRTLQGLIFSQEFSTVKYIRK